MNMYVWEDIQELTDNYHSDGGLVVLASSEARARELAIERGVKFGQNDVPDVYPLCACSATEEERVYLFPDAGCC